MTASHERRAHEKDSESGATLRQYYELVRDFRSFRTIWIGEVNLKFLAT